MAGIRLCHTNYDGDIEKVVMKIRRELAGVTLDIDKCTDGKGSKNLVAYVNNEMIEGIDSEDLYKKIREKLYKI